MLCDTLDVTRVHTNFPSILVPNINLEVLTFARYTFPDSEFIIYYPSFRHFVASAVIILTLYLNNTHNINSKIYKSVVSRYFLV